MKNRIVIVMLTAAGLAFAGFLSSTRESSLASRSPTAALADHAVGARNAFSTLLGGPSLPDAGPGHAHFVPGRRYVYDTSLRAALNLGDQEGTSLGIDVAGQLTLDASAQAGGGVRLIARFEDPSVSFDVEHEHGVDPTLERERQRMAADLATPFSMILDATGAVTSMQIADDLQAQSQQLLRSVASLMQLSQPKDSGARWETSEQDTSGTYLAHYESESQGTVVKKQKLEYTDTSRALGAQPLDKITLTILSSTAQFQIDRTASVSKVVANDALQVAASELLLHSESRTNLTMTLLRAEPIAAEIALALASDHTYTNNAIDAGPSARSKREVIDQAKIAGMTLKSALAVLDAHATMSKEDRQIRYRTFLSLEALFRQDPKAIEEVMAVIAEGGPHTKLLIEALGYAGTRQAQAALRDVFDNSKLSDELHLTALMSMRNSTNPAPETVGLHESLLDDELFQAQAHLGLGSLVSHSLQSNDAALADEGVQTLLGRLETASDPEDTHLAIQALGNAGHIDALPALTQLLQDESERTRRDALQALRKIPGTNVDDLLVGSAKNDPSGPVRHAALEVYQDREPTPPVINAFNDIARQDTEASVRYEAIERLRDQRVPPEAARDTLAWLATHDTDEDNRDLASDALATN